MSAIGGVFQRDGAPVARSDMARMETVLKPYGRDASAVWNGRRVALLRTLLRVTPEDALDRQPMRHSASGLVMVFDGRLDNRDELSDQLDINTSGRVLLADSDLALRAWIQWGEDCLPRLIGDFAIACWSERESRLFLARDPLGARPLFWYADRSRFLFASLPKGLFSQPAVPREVNQQAMSHYLACLPVPEEATLYQGIRKVEPGTVVVAGLQDERRSAYFRFDPEKRIRLASTEEYVQAFRSTFAEAVRARLRSSGKVASTLSSGRDSSAVTAVAAGLLGEQGRELLAYTAVPRSDFRGSAPKGYHGNEGPLAASVARRFENVRHFLIESPPSSPLDRLDAAIEASDRSPLNACNLGWISAIHEDAARRGAKVLLNGSFGNLTISHPGLSYLPWLLRHGRVVAWCRQILAMKRGPQFRKVSLRWLLYASVAPFLPYRVFRILAKRVGHDLDLAVHSPLSATMRQNFSQADREMRQPSADNRRETIESLRMMDFGEHAAEINLAGLERRDPTADRRLLEFCLGIPENLFLREGQTCWILKQALGDQLPRKVLHPSTKGYQSADWANHLGSREQYETMLASFRAHPTASRLLDIDGLQAVLDNWPENGFDSTQHQSAFRFKLLRGMAAGSFIRYVENSNRV